MANEKSCGTVVFRDKLFLLLHYSAGHWDFPKGHVEKGETEEQTALRELQEETGITDGKILSGFREPIHYFFTHHNERISKDVIFFVAETKTEAITISNEHQGFAWLPYPEALAKLSFKNSKDILKKAHDFLAAK